MADIFVSYKRDDRERVRPLVDALQGQGWSVWWDTRIETGEAWDQTIETELAAARCVVVVWSQNSVGSHWVRTEAHEGLERNCLVPVSIDGTKPPLAFKLIQAGDLSAWGGDPMDPILAHVCAGVARLLREPQVPMEQLTTPDALFTRGCEAMGEGGDIEATSERAIACFNRAIELDPEYAPAYRGRAEAHFVQQYLGLAVADFTKCLALDPADLVALTGRAQAHESAQRNDLALADYSAALELQPDADFVYAQRGIIYKAQGDYARAIADFDKAIASRPEFADLYLHRAGAYEKRNEPGDLARAIEDLRAALYFDPNSLDAKKELWRLTKSQS